VSALPLGIIFALHNKQQYHWLIVLFPLDHSQSLLSQQGPLAELQRFEGLYRIRLLPPVQPGEWMLRAESDGRLAFHVIGKRRTNKNTSGIERILERSIHSSYLNPPCAEKGYVYVDVHPQVTAV